MGLLGRGGMGSVYAARDRELDKVIALKTIRSSGEGAQLAVQRFKQELVLARKITHKNVVRIYDLGEADGIKFFRMKLIKAESRKDFLAHETSLAAHGTARDISSRKPQEQLLPRLLVLVRILGPRGFRRQS